MNQLQSMSIDELLETFDSLEDWEERCDYLIDLGFELPELPAEYKTEENRVRGCQSVVWLVADVKTNGSPTIELMADSDAFIVKGLIAVLMTLFSGRSPDEILATDVDTIFRRIGLDRHLSSTRRNGLHSMVKRIRGIAAQAI